MKIISKSNNTFEYKAKYYKFSVLKTNYESVTINKLIQYQLNYVYDIFSIIDIELIKLLLDLNEKRLLIKIKLTKDHFPLLRNNFYYNKKLYDIFKELYSNTIVY